MPHECPIPGLIDDLGEFFADDFSDRPEAGATALRRGLAELDELLATAYAPHEVVAAEVLLVGERGSRRTVFPTTPGPVPFLLLCTRLATAGDTVTLVQHTAACGSRTVSHGWPFGIQLAEEITRPPAAPASGPTGARLPAPVGPGVGDDLEPDRTTDARD